MDDGCLFCRIASGDESAHLIRETPDTVSFLDSRPLFEGHVLVIPRTHHETLMDLPQEIVGLLFDEVKRTSVAVRDAMTSDGIFVANNNGISQSVAHLHVHVVPRRKKDGLRGFMWPRRRYENSDTASQTAAAIRQCLEAADEN
jgi:histidine triad (HIT) family protein